MFSLERKIKWNDMMKDMNIYREKKILKSIKCFVNFKVLQISNNF